MTALAILALVAGILGMIGSVIPALPGPPLGWLGLFLAFLAKGTNGDGDPMSLTILLVFLGIATIVTILDYVIPAKFTKLTGGSKAAARGSIIGLFAGMFFTPVGMIAGSLIGAFLGEFIFADKGVWSSFMASIGSFLGFITTTFLKLVTCAVMLYYIFVFAF
ncbi:MAG: DUF456 domain-containing protein [Bacteroidales bacterium]|nr:DUF456 domain-containing protein [Bacteroidales bacterium]